MNSRPLFYVLACALSSSAFAGENSGAVFDRAFREYSEQNYEAAIRDYTHFLEIVPARKGNGPARARVFHNRGQARAALGDADGAMADYDRAVASDTSYFWTYDTRGEARRIRADLAGAMSDLNRAIELGPQYAQAYYHRALVKRDRYDFHGVIADCTAALTHFPNYAEAFQARGGAKGTLGDYAGAVADCQHAADLNPAVSNYSGSAGFFRHGLGELEAAEADCDRAIALDPKNFFAISNRARLRRQRGDLAGAVADLRKASMLGEAPAAHWLWLALTEQGDRTAAAKELRAALDKQWKVSPEDWDRQIAHYLLDETSEDQLLVLAAKTQPEFVQRNHYCQAWFWLGEKSRLAGDLERAASCFRKSLATEYKDTDATFAARWQMEKLATAKN